MAAAAMREDGGPAFPRADRFESGMTLRDYFAAKALVAEIVTSCSDATPESAAALVGACLRDGDTPTDHVAKLAYRWADAMLAAREAK